MRILQLLFLIGVGSFLYACSAIETLIPATSTAETNGKTSIPATLTMAPPSPTETHFPTQTQPPTSTAAAAVLPVTSTPKPVFQLCSPLAEQTLSELEELITGPYDPPPVGSDARHHGVDFSYYRRKDRITIEGEVVQAILPGEVVLVSGDQLPYGNMVIVETNFADLPEAFTAELGISPDESLYHLYAHFRTGPLVEAGDWVACGQPLGEVGKTGYNIVNPHLHLEMRIGPPGATFVGGMKYYDTRATELERKNYELWRTSGVFRHFDPLDLINFYLQSR